MDDFGDRMKIFEMAEAGRKFIPLLPIVARIDGRCFSKFTKGLDRPYDKRFSDLMIETTKYLVKETNACCGYTASDEITLSWFSNSFDCQIYFDGRISKMTSSLAASATAYFNYKLLDYLPENYRNKLPTFDTRVWNVPNIIEGANVYLWREQDNFKNSISMAARCHFSHKELMNKNGSEMQEMLFSKGINFNDFPSFFKRGTFIQRKLSLRKFSTSELEKLPEKHEARKNPDLMVERTDYVQLDMTPFNKVSNRPEVIFNGEEPKLHSLT